MAVQAVQRFDDDAGASTTVAERGSLRITLPLRHAGPRAVELRWERVGDPALPAVWVAGGISADRHVIASAAFPHDGWWQAQAAALATGKVQLLSFDWIGADGAHDVVIDPADQAAAIVALLDHLGIAALQAFLGSSYGAMVGLQLAARSPSRLRRLLAISGTHRSHPYASALRAVQRRIVALGALQCDAADGVALARELAMLTYRTPAEFDQRFAATAVQASGVVAGSDDYLRHCGRKYADRVDPVAFLRMNESIDLQCVDPADIHIPVTVVGVEQDVLVPVQDSRALAAALHTSRLVVLDSLYGHDAFLKEVGEIAELVESTLQPVSGVSA